MEKELLEAIRTKGKYSSENSLSDSKALLCRQIGRNGDNLYNLLVRLISRLLENPRTDAVDHFEEYCRLAKLDFFFPDGNFYHTHGTPKQHDASAQKQYIHAKHILNALTQIESEKYRLCPELNLLIQPGLNAMGRDLPCGYDFFISAQIDRTLRTVSEVNSCQFWGVVRSLGCDYYILEVEHREKSVDYCAVRGVIGKHPAIVTDVVSALVEDTIEKTNPAGGSEQQEGFVAESVEITKKLIDPLLMEIIRNVEDQDSELVQEHCQRTILAELIDNLSLETTRSSVCASSSLSDLCASESQRMPAESAASLLRGQLERMQLESRLNSRSYLVTENPCTKPWQRLPPVTLEQLQAIEGQRIFLVGNLKAKVRQTGRPFDGLEENLLRALVAKISSHRDGHIVGSETNISLVKCISGCTVTGYNHELLLERLERWCERNENGMKYWTSETWPGLYTFSDGDDFRCCYFGWGLEKLPNWYSPIVRIPEMREEYVVELDKKYDKLATELRTEDTPSIDVPAESPQ